MARKGTAKNNHNKEIGRRGEDAACRYLRLRGCEILERNWICPAGEADIIALDGGELVFVEVKTRTNLRKGFPSEAVDQKKRQRYEKIACWYLNEKWFTDMPVRFDIIALVVMGHDRAFLRHYRHAFEFGF